MSIHLKKLKAGAQRKISTPRFCFCLVVQLSLPLLQPPALIPGLGRFAREGNINLLQYSCLENSMDRGAWWVTVHGVTNIQRQLSDLHPKTS